MELVKIMKLIPGINFKIQTQKNKEDVHKIIAYNTELQTSKKF